MTSTSWSRKTTRSRWDRLEELFNQAVDLPDEEREQFVARETGEDAELREELLGLLACDTGKRTGPLTHALGEALDSTTRDKRRAHLGQVVGNYKLTSVLGHGGTGTVYLGERADKQYSAQVAVKIVDSAAVQGDLATRFRAERQILASLNHANIARLMDAGEADNGQPYLVMEYVQGQALDQYCDERRLDINARLKLFLEICAAVQYAHQNLVVHRDLKPANILVTTEGVPKLLDFGIAKLLDPVSNASALALTRINDRLLTPEYASPEQILGKQVTTASDVYALGVVLYELLTGLRPFVVPDSASQLELERSICVTDPPRPSATPLKVPEQSTVDDRHTPATIALSRGLTPERLQRRLAGDLDAIVMRALRKEPQHRYGSVDQFIADVRRYLANEPVQARQGTWVYYSQRFIRRNTLAVAAGTGFVLFTLAFAIAMSIQTQRTAEERDRATQESEYAENVSEFMLNVFAAADPFVNFGREFTARELLDLAGRAIKDDLKQQPEVRARLMEAIGRAYRRQGQPERAIQYLTESVAIRKATGGENVEQISSVQAELAIALQVAGDFDQSDRVFREALSRFDQSSEEPTKERLLARARLLGDFGRLEFNRGHSRQAENYLLTSLKMMRDINGPRHTEVAELLTDIANARLWRDDLGGAELASREAVSIYRNSVSKLHPDRVTADAQLSEILLLKGLTEEAGALSEAVLTARKTLYGKTSSIVADSLDALAKIRIAQGRPREAEGLLRDALGVNRDANMGAHPSTGYLQTSLAFSLMQQGRYGEAEDELRSALRLLTTSTLPSDHQYIAAAEHFLGESLIANQKFPEAIQVLEASVARWQRTTMPAWRAARSASALGEAEFREGKFEDAERHLLESYKVLSTAKGADRETVARARERITRFYKQRGETDKLNALLSAGPRTAAVAN